MLMLTSFLRVLLIFRMLLPMCLLLFVVSAQAAVTLVNSGDAISPAQGLRYFQDPTRLLTIEDILAQRPHPEWQDSRDAVLNLGFRKGAVWIELQVENASLQSDWMLAVESPLLRYLDVFVVRGGDLRAVFQTGDRFEFAARPVAHRHFLFPVSVPLHEKVTLYLRAEAPYPLVFPMHFYSVTDYLQTDNRATWFYGLLCGFMLVMSLYNFFVFTATRDSSYFYYAMFSVCMNFFLLSLQGFGYEYLWPETIYWQQKSHMMTMLASVLFGSQFVIAFLRLRETSPSLHVLIQGVSLVAILLLLVGIFVDDSNLVEASYYLTEVACVLALISGVVAWGRGRYEARFFVLAWFVFLGAALLFCLSLLGYISYTPERRYAVEVGVAVQLVLLSFALADRINHERKLRQSLEEQSQHYQRQHLLAKERALEREIFLKEDLERRVDERTLELHEAMEKLSTMNRRLELINQLDEVTGLHNQNYFFDVLRREWDRALREQRCVSLLVIELDDFNLIRERHGDVIQDECLKLVAGLLRETFSRPADVVVRYGDKVFGVLLPETELHGARQLALGVCSHIAVAPHDFGLCRILLSVSIGIACSIPVTHKNCKELLETAESALYVAHSNGGNQVQTAMIEA